MNRADIDMASPAYTPNRLLNAVAEHFGLADDATLAHMLECHQSLLSRARSKKDPITPFLMVQIMDRTNWPVKKVRELMGSPFDGGVIVARRVAITSKRMAA